MSGLRAARDLNGGGGEPSPDVLFSRRPSRKRSTATTDATKEPAAARQPARPPTKKLAKKPMATKSVPTAVAPKACPAGAAATGKDVAPETSNSPTQLKPPAPKSPRATSSPSVHMEHPQQGCSECAKRSSETAASAKKIMALNATIEKMRSDMESDKAEQSTLIATLRGDLKTAQDEVLSLVKLGRDQQRHFDVEQAAWRERERQLVDTGTATLTREKELEDKILSFKTGLEESNKKSASLEALYAKVVEECDTFRAEAVALRSECKEQRTRSDHSEAQLLLLKEELERVRADHTKMQTSAISQEALREAEARAQTATERAKEAESTVAALQQEMKRLNGRVSTAEALPNRLREEIRSAAEKNFKQLERVEADALQVRELLREETSKSALIEKERDDLASRVREMQSQVRKLTMDAKGMNAEEFEDTFEAVMREEFDAMRNAYEGKLKALKADSSKQRNIHEKSLRDAQKDMRSKMVTLKTEVMRRDAMIAQMREEIAKMS
eukprot:g625.t1